MSRGGWRLTRCAVVADGLAAGAAPLALVLPVVAPHKLILLQIAQGCAQGFGVDAQLLR